MDYRNNMGRHEVLPEVIEDLAEAESRMIAARNKMIEGPGYESIAAHISSALAAVEAALAEAHNKLHES